MKYLKFSLESLYENLAIVSKKNIIDKFRVKMQNLSSIKTLTTRGSQQN